MDTNENKKKIKVIPMLVILVVIVLACVVISFGMFKSNGQKFMELLTKDQYIVKLIDERNEKLSSNGERKYNMSLSNNFLSLLDSSFGLIGGNLTLDANVIKKGNDFDTSATLSLGSIELQSLEVIKEKDTVALSVPNLFDNYIAVNDNKLEEAAYKLGFMSGDDIGNKNFEEKASKIFKKYAKVLARSINDFVVTEKADIIINEENLSTTCYKVSLGEKELTKVEVDLLEKLKDDEETIEFIVEFVKENEGISDSIKEEFTKERLKGDLLNLYNQALEKVSQEIEGEPILVISLYENDGKNVKTLLNFQNGENSYGIILESISNELKDYVLLSFDITDMVLNLEYEGNMLDNNYAGGILVSTDGASISIFDLNIETVKDSTATVRKIKDLNALLLNEASDEELEALKNEIETNLGITDDINPYEELEEMVYEEGEFVLDNPENRVNVLEASRESYNKITIGMTKDEVIQIMGEPLGFFEADSKEYAGWYYGDSESIYFISIELDDGIVNTVYNDIASSMADNVQVSTELGTEIEDLSEIARDIEDGMTKEEVISILGDKYVEIYKDSENYFGLKWYDKKENSLIIEFDNEGKIFYINTVSMDM